MTKFLKGFVLGIWLLCFYNIKSSGQTSMNDSLCNCSVMMKTKSFFWKNDSLANNGYRLCSAEALKNCKLDNINLRYILENLGKPNRIEKSNLGIEYIYFYYDYRKLPKAPNLSKAVYYLSFHFEEAQGFLIYIEDGHYD